MGPLGAAFSLLVPLACAPQEQGGGGPAAGGAELRPNVLLIVVDDLRPALGCYGDPLARTPRIDALADEGILFERAYCQQALCHPSRTSFLTGLRPATTGVRDLRSDFRARVPGAVTLPQLFREAGWRSIAAGKVHHGGGRLDDGPSWSAAPWWPPRSPAYFTDEGRAVAAARREHFAAEGFEDVAVRGLAWEAPEVEDRDLVDGWILEEALARLDELAGERFFLAVGFKKPHLPFVAPARHWEALPEQVELAPNDEPPAGMPPWAGTDWGELRAYHGMPAQGPLAAQDARALVRGYHACVAHVDFLVGELLDGLERRGLDGRTIVVLLGDHGFQLGEHGMWCKHTNLEEATRSPLILRLPPPLRVGRMGRAEGARSSALVELVDLYPTLAELCGLAAPERLEGTSLVPLLAEPGREWKRAAFSEYPAADERGRDLLGTSMRTQRQRLTVWEAGEELVAAELYDYELDPRGTRNLAGEAAHAEELARLLAQLRAGWRAALPGAD